MNTEIKNLFIKLIFLLLIIVLPWSFNPSNLEAPFINEDTLGFYKSNTCELNFGEFLLNNLNNKKVEYNLDTFSSINCFGKINGVDIINNNYVVSVGTNIIIDLLYQSAVWIIVLSFIRKNSKTKEKDSYLLLTILWSIFCISQYLSEGTFFNFYNKYFDNSLSINNFFLLSLLVVYFLIGQFTVDVVEKRSHNLLNYSPFIFLLVGTYNANNINFYLLIFSFIGIRNLNKIKLNKYLIYIYSLFLFVWLFSLSDNSYFFDPDKLRGFTNSSMTIISQFFWIIIVTFTLLGIYYLFKNSQEINIEKIKLNFLISGSLIVFLGILGGRFAIINVFNSYYFGQNKRGMKTLLSIEGNTWRGFSSSAEAIGEFFGFAILFYFIVHFISRKRPTLIEIVFILVNFYGIIKTNNFASIASLILILSVLIGAHYLYLNKKFVVASLLVVLFGLFFMSLNNLGYEYISKHLLLEASMQSNLFVGAPEYENADRFFKENDVGTLVSMYDNKDRMSNTLLLLINIFTQNFNFPLIPNPVALISFISIVINRTRLWGIFIAKYNPDILNLFFGYGPLQLNEYYFGHQTLPLNGLVLPHSSLLDGLIFFGVFGIGLLFYIFYKYFNKYKNNISIYLLLYLLVNFIKSDSLLYFSSFFLLVFTINLIKIMQNKITKK